MEGYYEQALENQKELYWPIFVVGHARSGTGLTARALGLSPQTCYLGETSVFAKTYFSEAPLLFGLRLAMQYRLFSRPSPFLTGIKMKAKFFSRKTSDLPRLVRCMFRYCKLGKNFTLQPSNPLADIMGIESTSSEEHWIDLFTKKYRMLIRKDPDSWVRIMFKDCSIISHSDVVLEKTPLHVLCMPLIWRIFPEAKIIATVRDDIKEVLASYYFMTQKRHLLPRMLKVYKMSKDAINKATFQNLGLLLPVRYEDWVADPSAIWEKIFSFTGIDMPQNSAKHIAYIKRTPSKFERADENIKSEIKRLLRTTT